MTSISSPVKHLNGKGTIMETAARMCHLPLVMDILRRTHKRQIKVGSQDVEGSMLRTMNHVAFGMAVTALETY